MVANVPGAASDPKSWQVIAALIGLILLFVLGREDLANALMRMG